MNENTTLSNEKKPFSSLSKIIILKIIAISSLVTVISTGIQLYRDYSQNVSKVDNDIKRVSNLICKSCDLI